MTLSSLKVSGVTVAKESAIMKSEVKGVVKEIVAQEGIHVKAGKTVIKLMEDDYKANVERAKAVLSLRKLEYENSSSLVAKGYSTKVRKTETYAAYESAKADLLTAEINYEKRFIKAPFDGYLEEIAVKAGDFVDVGTEITKILKLNPIEIQVYIPEKYMKSVVLGGQAKIKTALGYELDGKVAFISKSALATTRSYLVKLESDNTDYKIPEGLTVTLELPLKEAKAHEINSSILTLNAVGEMGVKVVSSENKVEFYKVEILKEDDKGIWVFGLPEETRIITVGQEYVVEGEVIKTIVEENN